MEKSREEFLSSLKIGDIVVLVITFHFKNRPKTVRSVRTVLYIYDDNLFLSGDYSINRKTGKEESETSNITFEIIEATDEIIQNITHGKRKVALMSSIANFNDWDKLDIESLELILDVIHYGKDYYDRTKI